MPTILNTAPAQALPKIALGHCRIKQAWSDPWVFVPWLQPIQTTDMAAPSIGSADLLYYFGRCKLEHETAFSVKTPVELADYYVQVLSAKQGYPAQVVWTGIIADEATELVGKEVLTGAQKIKAYSMAHLLDRVEISTSWFRDRLDIESEVWNKFAFNQRSRYGQSILGNRSDDPDDANDQLYYFSEQTSVWTNRNIVEYLLAKYAPEGITWELDGQVDLLDELEQVYKFNGTVWDALTKLIDFRRGIGFRVSVQEPEGSDEGTVKLSIFSLIDVDVKVGDKTLAKNPNQVPFIYPTAHPYDKMVEPIPLRKTSLNQYDVIEIQASAQLKVCASFSFDDGNLEEAWDITTLQAAYLEGTGSSDFIDNDKARAKDRFKDVFGAFRVPKDWDKFVGENLPSLGDSPNRDIVGVPAVLDDGSIVGASIITGNWTPIDKRFFPTLPFEVGKRYDTSPITDETDPDKEPSYQNLLVIIYDGDSGADHTADQEFHIINRMSEENEGLRNPSVSLLDKEMGFKLGISPRHYFAKNHWTGAKATDREPEMDYKNLIVTGFFEVDEIPRVVLEMSEEDDGSDKPEKRLIIVVPGTEVWLAPPKTIVGINEEGTDLLRIHDDNLLLRDDRDKLEAVAAFAKAWYGVKRQAVTITLHSIGLFVELGTFVTEIDGVVTREPVRTVVTGRSINWNENTTTIETGFDTLDVRGLAGVADSFI